LMEGYFASQISDLAKMRCGKRAAAKYYAQGK
jgi:hypothetical protein